MVELASEAATLARERCHETYGIAPDIHIVTPNLPKGAEASQPTNRQKKKKKKKKKKKEEEEEGRRRNI